MIVPMYYLCVEGLEERDREKSHSKLSTEREGAKETRHLKKSKCHVVHVEGVQRWRETPGLLPGAVLRGRSQKFRSQG